MNEHMLEIFSEQRIDPNRDNIDLNELFIMYAAMINIRHMETLLKNGADVNYKDKYGVTAIEYAAMFGNMDMLKMLIAYGVDITSEKFVPLVTASVYGHIDMVRFLLENGVNPNYKGSIILELAVGRKYMNIAKLLVLYGAKR